MLRGRRNAARTRRIRRSVIKGLQRAPARGLGPPPLLIEAIGSDDSDPDAGHDPLADQPSGDSTDDFAALSTTGRAWVGNGPSWHCWSPPRPRSSAC